MKRLVVVVLLIAASPVFSHEGDKNHNGVDGKIVECTKLIEEHPDDFHLFGERGRLYLHGNSEYELALADFERALELSPKWEPAFVYRGIVRFHMGDWKGALADFDRVCSQNTTIPGAWFSRGEVKLALGGAKGALADFDKAIEVVASAPADKKLRRWSLLHVRRAEAKLALGDDDGALAEYDEALKLDARHVEALIGRAQLKARRKDPTSTADMETAAGATLRDPRVYAAQARILHDKGASLPALQNANGALELYRAQVETATSRNFKAELLLAMAHVSLESKDDPIEALQLVNEALGNSFDRPELHRMKVLLLQKLKNVKPEAIANAKDDLAAVEKKRLP